MYPNALCGLNMLYFGQDLLNAGHDLAASSPPRGGGRWDKRRSHFAFTGHSGAPKRSAKKDTCTELAWN